MSDDPLLCDDAWMLVATFLDWASLACLVCGTSRELRDSLAPRLCRALFAKLKPSASILGAACLIMTTRPSKRDELLRLLAADTRLYARRVDEDGNKMDDQLCLYKVRLVDYATGMYRYSRGARVVGQRSLDMVCLDRIFVVAPHVLAGFQDVDDFDDDGARVQMLRMQDRFDEADRALLGALRPVFGFLDGGHVIARSSQCVVVNPRLVEE